MTALPAPVGGKLSLDPSRYPALAPEGGALLVDVPGLTEPLLVVHVKDRDYRALSGLCPHSGCPLGVSDGQVECPCHLSLFDLDGKVLRPPAKQGLGSYPARFEATSGDVIIDLAAGDADMPPYQDGAVVFPLSLYPALAQAGGSVVGVPQGLGRAILVLARPGGGYSAMDATCTHLACLVEWSAQDGRVECPCHGSAFDETGAKIIGPAPTSLKGYAAALVDGSVRVSIPA
jgi:Rieske Fe-S protein